MKQRSTASVAPNIGTYDGSTIDLSQGWGGAQACIVPLTGGTECFATTAEAQAAAVAISQSELQSAAAAAGSNVRGSSLERAKAALHGSVDVAHSACQGSSGEWLWLYQNANYGGQAIGFQDVNEWFDLANYGFSDEMSSYSNDTACTVYMIQNLNGSGPWLTVGGWGYSSYVGSAWNDKVVAVDISD